MEIYSTTEYANDAELPGAGATPGANETVGAPESTVLTAANRIAAGADLPSMGPGAGAPPTSSSMQAPEALPANSETNLLMDPSRGQLNLLGASKTSCAWIRSKSLRGSPCRIGRCIKARRLGLRPLMSLVCALLALVRIAPASGNVAGQQGQALGEEMTNAGPLAAALENQHRRITANGFVKTGPAVFIDATENAGLSKWRNVTGTLEKRMIIEAKGSGVCFLDYENPAGSIFIW